MKILLTGAAGNLGSACFAELVKAGHEVVATDISRRPGLPGKVRVGDLLNREFCYEVAEDVKCLVHIANLPHAGAGTPQRVFHDNVTMNMNLFQAAVESGCRRIMYASSIQAMGGTRRSGDGSPSKLAYLPIDGDTPQNPGNAYGLSKCVGEQQLRYFLANGKIDEAVALRFPLLLSSHGMAHFRERRGQFGSGSFFTDEAFTWLGYGDAARLVAAIVSRPLPGYRCYLPASPQPRLNEPTRKLAEEYFPGVPRKGDPDGPLCDISRITADTGWVPVEKLWE